jgi:hypothetical protein
MGRCKWGSKGPRTTAFIIRSCKENQRKRRALTPLDSRASDKDTN